MHNCIYYLAVILRSEWVKPCRVWIWLIPGLLHQLEWLHFLLISFFVIKYVENVGIQGENPPTTIVAIDFLLMDCEINILLAGAMLLRNRSFY